jgi:hypothetical protein
LCQTLIAVTSDKGKPDQSQGRKATGPRFLRDAFCDATKGRKIAGLPEIVSTQRGVKMKTRSFVNVLFAIGILALASPSALAQPAKATAKVGNVNVLNVTSFGWTTILSGTIMTAQENALFIDVSLETGIYTQTKTRSNGNKDTSGAEATIKVQVLVDGVPAYPGDVVFDRQSQTLSETLGGILANCTDSNGDGDIDLNDCTLAPEEMELIQDTMAAHSFNFIMDHLTPGEHAVEVQAMISTSSSSGAGSASSNATIGNGSVTVEGVRLNKGEDIQL